MSNSLVRILAEAVAAPVLLYVLFLPGSQYFSAVVTVMSVFGLYELFVMLRRRGFRPFMGLGYAILLLIHISAYQGIPRLPVVGFLVQPVVFVTLLVLGLLVAQVARGHSEENLPNMSVTAFAVLYIGWLSSFMIRLRGIPEGEKWVFLLIIITTVFDTGAYAWGMNFGKTKMWVDVSPGKSWEGFWGGTVTALVVVWLFQALPDVFPSLPRLFPSRAATPMLLILALVGAAFAQLGDLAESMVKRYTKVKDSGMFLPGHGGMLDRIDSFLFTAPLVYMAAVLMGAASF
jgi:phosphatidate cytidylyltransferase